MELVFDQRIAGSKQMIGRWKTHPEISVTIDKLGFIVQASQTTGWVASQIRAFCMVCKKVNGLDDVQVKTLRTGKQAWQGHCAACGNIAITMRGEAK
jgi:hypothetical protein